MSLPKESVGGEIVDRDRDHEPAAAVITRHPWDPARIVLFTPQDVVCQARFLHVSGCAEQFAGRGERLGDFGDESGRAQNCELRAQRREQVAAVTLPSMIGMDGDLVNEGPDGRLAPISTAIGAEPEKATMQLLHQTWRSRIDRLNAAGVISGSSGTYGARQRFSASTSRPMSSVRQKRYADIVIQPGASPRPPPLKLRRGSPKRLRREGGRTPQRRRSRGPRCPLRSGGARLWRANYLSRGASPPASAEASARLRRRACGAKAAGGASLE